jgi:hypothetical protein
MVSLGQLWRLRAPGSIAGVCQKFEEFDAERARGQVTSGRSFQGLEDLWLPAYSCTFPHRSPEQSITEIIAEPAIC